jgi:hypothetical protein
MFLRRGLDRANQVDPLQQFRLNENGLIARWPVPRFANTARLAAAFKNLD